MKMWSMIIQRFLPEMMSRWCRATTGYTRAISRRSSLLPNQFSAYSRVAAAAQPAVANPSEKSSFSGTEVSKW